jgi:hypothetical protein
VGFLTVASFACLLIGWFASRAVHASFATAPVTVSQKASTGTPAPVSTPEAVPRSTSSLTERVDQINQRLTGVGSGTETALAAFALAETLQSDEYPAAIATVASSTNLRGSQALLFGYWVERDLEKALAWYESLDPARKSTFSSSLLDTWSAMDPGAALTWLEKQPEAARKSMLRTSQQNLARRVGPIEPDRVLALLMPIAGDSGMIDRTPESGVYSSPMGGNQSGVYIFFSALAEKAPENAAARALQFPSGTHRTSAAIAVAKAWANSNPTAAKKWAEKIDDAALSAQVVPACAMGLAEKDPRQAAEWLGAMPATLPNREAMKEILDTWGQKDTGGALAWLDSLPPDSGAEELTAAVFKTLNRQDPVKALDVIKQRLDEGKPLGEDFAGWVGIAYVDAKGPREALRFAESSLQHPNSWASECAFRSLVHAAATQIPKEAAEWALQQPSSSRRSAALDAAGESLVRENEENGYHWINSLPRDVNSDEARISIADQFFRKDPKKGESLLVAVTDKKTAEEKLFNCAYWGLMGGKSPDVEQWLEQTNALSAEKKAEVLRAVANSRKQFKK